MAARDPIGDYVRGARAQRRVGLGAKCVCGETRPFALITGSQPVECYACQRTRHRSRGTEEHHAFGKRNSALAVNVPVNDHRAVLSVAQYQWPPQTLSNPHDCELREAAARLRGAADIMLYFIEDNRACAERLERRCEAECKHAHEPKAKITNPRNSRKKKENTKHG